MFRSDILRILSIAMNSPARNLWDTGSSNADSCHTKAEITDHRGDVLETNSAVFFLFPPKHRWQESRKTGKMRLGKTKEPARSQHGLAPKQRSLNHQHTLPIEKSVKLTESCGEPCLIHK
jgi:hypothetical protein